MPVVRWKWMHKTTVTAETPLRPSKLSHYPTKRCHLQKIYASTPKSLPAIRNSREEKAMPVRFANTLSELKANYGTLKLQVTGKASKILLNLLISFARCTTKSHKIDKISQTLPFMYQRCQSLAVHFGIRHAPSSASNYFGTTWSSGWVYQRRQRPVFVIKPSIFKYCHSKPKHSAVLQLVQNGQLSVCSDVVMPAKSTLLTWKYRIPGGKK